MHKKNLLTEPQITAFLYKLKNGDINDKDMRRRIINIFINAIYLYDDHFKIIFNGGGKPVIVDADLLEDINNYFNSENSTQEECSQLNAVAPP